MTRLKTLAGLLLAAAVAAPALSMAQDRDDHRDDHRATQERHDDHGVAQDRHDNHGMAQEHHDDRAMRGAGPDHNWHKGDRIPTSYRDKRYEVSDWKARKLRQPPRGYHWVNVNGDFVLAAVATGVIAELLLNN